MKRQSKVNILVMWTMKLLQILLRDSLLLFPLEKLQEKERKIREKTEDGFIMNSVIMCSLTLHSVTLVQGWSFKRLVITGIPALYKLNRLRTQTS